MPILITRCFSETTPESIDYGDFSDSGMISENIEYTFRELIDLLMVHNICSQSHNKTDIKAWFCVNFTKDYATCTDREETIHFSKQNKPRMIKYWVKAVNYVQGVR